MAKSDPVGKINERADGAVWAKDANMDWKQIRDGNKAGRSAAAPAVGAPSPGVAPAGAPGDEANPNPWTVHQKKYGLDGHLPDPTMHPQHVNIDVEGDIDTKPVMSWVDAVGVPRNSYTTAFHRHRSLAQREKIKKIGTDVFRTAHAKLKAGMVTAGTPKERDAHAAAFIHLVGGHRISDILGMHAMHVATTMPHQGGEAPDSGQELVPTEVSKSSSEDPNSQFRSHMVLQHPHGHLYPASHHDEGLADHLRNRVNERASAPSLFEADEKGVRKALDGAGLEGVDEATIRHHAVMHMAADKLSKLAPVSLELDYATGMAQLIANLQQVSDEIGENFGHDPAPEGMSYVPPVLVAAYVEESGGAKHWPKVFRRTAAPEAEKQEVEKSVCTSPNEATRSSSAAFPTTSEPSDKTSPSSPEISLPLPRTPTPSPQSSSTAAPDQPAPPSQEQPQEVSKAAEPVIVPVRTNDDNSIFSGAKVAILPPKVKRAEYPFTGYVCFQGLDIDIENEEGSYREGQDKDGHKWRCYMHAHYGEFRKGEGTDGDKLDAYVGPYADSPLVVVIRQVNPNTKAYDEDKVMLGFLTVDAAVETYKKQYDKPGFYGGCDIMSIGEFHRWMDKRGKRGDPVEGPVSTPDQPVLVRHANEGDERLRSHLHQMLGTQYPSPVTALRKKLAEKALGKAVGRARAGSLSITELEKAHKAYKNGDYRECCQILVTKSVGAGSAGSTGSTGSTGATTQKAGRRAEAGAGGGKPGPEGVPVGTITVLSDGTKEQKIGPHEWRRMGEGGDSIKKPEKAKAESGGSKSPTIDVAMDELQRLRQRRATAGTQELRLELDEQIEALRKRISKLKRGFGKTSDSSQARQRSQQGQSASRAPRDKRPEREESTKELAKSIRSATALHTAAQPDGLIPWFEERERDAAAELDDFLASQPSVEVALINLSKATPELLVHITALARQHGPSGLKNYIAVRIGGNRGAS